MANEYLVVTISGGAVILEEAFGDNQDAAKLLASGTGDYIIYGYDG